MTLKFDIQVDIPDSIITEPATKAEHIIAELAMKDTDPYVPMRSGSMKNKTQTTKEEEKPLIERRDVEGGTIIYPGPYARYLYYGKLMVDAETGSAWARPETQKVLTDKNLVFNKSSHPKAQAHWFEVSKAANIDKWVKAALEAMRRG